MLITNAQLKDVLDANFADIRCTSILIFLRDLLERKKHGAGIEQYRVKNLTTGNWITSLEDFASLIDADKLKMSYWRAAEKMGGDRIHPFAVMIDNFEVMLDKNSDEDANFIITYGSTPNRIMFLMNYLSDTDPALPLKIYEIKLV